MRCNIRTHELKDCFSVYSQLENKTGKHIRNHKYAFCEMSWISKETWNRAVGMLAAEMTQIVVAIVMNNTQKTISFIWNKFRSAGSTDNRQRSGRPRVTTSNEERRVRSIHLRNRFAPAVNTAAHALRRTVNVQTVQNRLKQFRLSVCCVYKEVRLTLLICDFNI